VKTTLYQIRDHNPCISGWKTLLRTLGKTEADGEEVSMLTILESNGVEDALWCLRAVDGFDREKRRLALWLFRLSGDYLADKRSWEAIDSASNCVNGSPRIDRMFAAQSPAYECYMESPTRSKLAAYYCAYSNSAISAYSVYDVLYAGTFTFHEKINRHLREVFASI
jgi:hypothetical protein